MYSVRFTRNSRREFLGLDATTRRRLRAQLVRLAEWPTARLDVKRLRGRRAGQYRLRVGKYRVIFVVDEERKRISLREIGHRGAIY